MTTAAPSPAPPSSKGSGGGGTSTAGTSSKSGGTKNPSKTATKASGAGTKAKKPARRKKPSTKSSSTSSNQATYNAARAAQMELASQKNQTALKLGDPLWYRVEDFLPSEETVMGGSPKVLPEQVQIVEKALAQNKMTRADVTPQAFACLLEQARRFALDIAGDAQDYAFVANRQEITRADLLLASEMRPDHPISISTQLPKLNLLAQQINRVPLPPIPTQSYSGVVLPPARQQLTARTFDVVAGAQVMQRMVQAAPSPPAKKTSSGRQKPSYGAARGRQIQVNLKDKQKEASSTSDGGLQPMDTSTGAPAAASASTS